MAWRELNKWKVGRIFLPAKDFLGIIGTAGADTGQSNGGPVVAVQAGAGELGVVQMAAAGDEIATLMPLPPDMKRDAPVAARVWFCHSSTDADTPVFKVLSKFHAKQATLVDIDTSEDKLTTFSAHTCSTTAESLEVTDWTDLSWEDYLTDSDVAVGIILECDNLGSASANEIELLGLEIAYEIEATQPELGTVNNLLLENPV